MTYDIYYTYIQCKLSSCLISVGLVHARPNDNWNSNVICSMQFIIRVDDNFITITVNQLQTCN